MKKKCIELKGLELKKYKEVMKLITHHEDIVAGLRIKKFINDAQIFCFPFPYKLDNENFDIIKYITIKLINIGINYLSFLELYEEKQYTKKN